MMKEDDVSMFYLPLPAEHILDCGEKILANPPDEYSSREIARIAEILALLRKTVADLNREKLSRKAWSRIESLLALVAAGNRLKLDYGMTRDEFTFELREGGKKAGKKTGAKKAAKADAEWRDKAFPIAKAYQDETGAGQVKIARHIKEVMPDETPDHEEIKRIVGKWQKEGKLARKRGVKPL